jgi:predicted NBD/HSP70 family sugar kinase
MLLGTENLLARTRELDQNRKRPGFDTLDALIDAAFEGHPLAIETLEFAGRQLGLGLAMLLNLFNPAVVVVGGGIVRAGDLLLGPLRETVARHCFSENFLHVRILPSRLGESATARGAATLIFEEAVESPGAFFKHAERKLRLVAS